MKTEEYKLWFDKAGNNLKWAKDNLKEGSYPLVCFLAQQAAELAIKGYYYLKEIVPPKTHSVQELLKKSERFGLKINEDLIVKATILTKYYFESRYPDMLDEDLNNKDIAAEALEFAKVIVEAIKKQISL